MNAKNTKNTNDGAVSSFLGRLGFGSAREESEGTGPQTSGSANGDARRLLLDDIATFLLAHDLAVSPTNLVIAYGAFSGANPGLARQIAARTRAGEAVTQEWLDETTATDEEENAHDGLNLLIAKLESTLEAFAQSSQAARNSTAHYGNELEQHVAEMESVQDAGTIISNLADLTKAMLQRTRTVEQEMRRSEDEAAFLRRSLDKAKRDAEVDHLTGLPNRRAFESLLETHYREAQATLEPLCVGFCDIDFFKRVNDTHGHDAGDRVLKEVGESLRAITNDNCHVARHGGEEFVMLFRGVGLTEAHQRLDAVREKLAGRNLVNRSNDLPFGQITFSGGVADVFAYKNPREALKAADEALYSAKEGGRNRIVVAGG